MGRYINWPEGAEGDKRVLALLCGAFPATQDQAAQAVNDPEVAPLVWTHNGVGTFDVLAYADSEAEFTRMTRPEDKRPKNFFIVNRAVAEKRAR